MVLSHAVARRTDCHTWRPLHKRGDWQVQMQGKPAKCSSGGCGPEWSGPPGGVRAGPDRAGRPVRFDPHLAYINSAETQELRLAGVAWCSRPFRLTLGAAGVRRGLAGQQLPWGWSARDGSPSGCGNSLRNAWNILIRLRKSTPHRRSTFLLYS